VAFDVEIAKSDGIDSPSYCRILLRLKEEKKDTDRVDFKLKKQQEAAQVSRRRRTRVHQLYTYIHIGSSIFCLVHTEKKMDQINH
jgi:hypothetical protein